MPYNYAIRAGLLVRQLSRNLKFGPSLKTLILKDVDGSTALTFASEHGEVSTVKLLIENYNANVTELGAYGRNCYLAAAVGGKDETLRYLHANYPRLASGKDEYGRTALILASQYGELSTVKLLIEEFNANVYKPGQVGRNCYLAAAQGGKDETIRYPVLVEYDKSKNMY